MTITVAILSFNMSNWTTFKRAFSFGWINFRKARESSWIIVAVIGVVVFLASSMFLLRGVSEAVIDQVRQQVSIAAYFQRGTDMADMAQIRDDLLERFPEEIRAIEVVSAEQALSHFQGRYRGDPLYQRALDQVGDNPFMPSLDIVVEDPARYADIADHLTANHADRLSKVDYHNREETIDRVFAAVGQARFFGLTVSVLLAALVLLIAFSTIRFSIQNSRHEIETMKLVGAPTWFTRAPFVFQGIIAGLLAALLVFMMFWPISYFLSPRLESAIPDFSLWQYYLGNIFWLAGLQFLTGLFLGWASTLLAVRRYLKV